jgi:hypothetical protein
MEGLPVTQPQARATPLEPQAWKEMLDKGVEGKVRGREDGVEGMGRGREDGVEGKVRGWWLRQSLLYLP